MGDELPDGPKAHTRLALAERARQSIVARFASVGVINTAVDFGLYLLLVLLGTSPLLANFVSTSAGMTVSFLGNRRFVFGATGARTREITLFVIVCGIGVWVVQPAVIYGVTALAVGAGIPDRVVLPIAKVMAVLVAAAWNFILYQQLVFRGGHRPTRGRESA